MKRLTWLFILFFSFIGLGSLAASAQTAYGYRYRPAPRYYTGYYGHRPMASFYFYGQFGPGYYGRGYYGPGYYRHERWERRRFIRHEMRDRRQFIRHERRERWERRHGRW